MAEPEADDVRGRLRDALLAGQETTVRRVLECLQVLNPEAERLASRGRGVVRLSPEEARFVRELLLQALHGRAPDALRDAGFLTLLYLLRTVDPAWCVEPQSHDASGGNEGREEEQQAHEQRKAAMLAALDVAAESAAASLAAAPAAAGRSHHHPGQSEQSDQPDKPGQPPRNLERGSTLGFLARMTAGELTLLLGDCLHPAVSPAGDGAASTQRTRAQHMMPVCCAAVREMVFILANGAADADADADADDGPWGELPAQALLGVRDAFTALMHSVCEGLGGVCTNNVLLETVVEIVHTWVFYAAEDVQGVRTDLEPFLTAVAQVAQQLDPGVAARLALLYHVAELVPALFAQMNADTALEILQSTGLRDAIAQSAETAADGVSDDADSDDGASEDPLAASVGAGARELYHALHVCGELIRSEESLLESTRATG